MGSEGEGAKQKRRADGCPSAQRSRGGAIRTPDLLNPIQARYRAALRPDDKSKYSESVKECQIF